MMYISTSINWELSQQNTKTWISEHKKRVCVCVPSLQVLLIFSRHSVCRRGNRWDNLETKGFLSTPGVSLHTLQHTHTHIEEVTLFQSIFALVYYSRKKSHQCNSPILFKLLWCSSQPKTVGNNFTTVRSTLVDTQTHKHTYTNLFLICREALHVIEPYLDYGSVCICVLRLLNTNWAPCGGSYVSD